MSKKCKIKSAIVMKFATISGEVCYLNFGCNTKFAYKELDNGYVRVFRKNCDMEIKKQDFERMFEIID